MKRNVRQALARTLLAGVALAAVVGVVVGARLAGSWIAHGPERTEQARQRQVAESEGTEVPILCVGSSHTASRHWIPGYSFPDQLEGILKDRYPGVPFTVKNAARFGLTSEGVLKALAVELGRKKYRWVAIMIGELQDGRLPLQAPSPVLAVPEVPEIPGRSRRFPETSLSDVNILALKWAGLLSLSFNWQAVESRPVLAMEALAALKAWRPDTFGESARTVFGVRALLQARLGRAREAEETLGRLLKIAGPDYDLFAELTLEELERRKRSAAELVALKTSLAGRKISKVALEVARGAFDGHIPGSWDVPQEARPALVEEALHAAPGLMVLHGLQIRLLESAHSLSESERHARGEALQARGYWENPFQPGQLSGPEMARTRPTDTDFVAHFNRRFPSLAISAKEAVREDDTRSIAAQLHEAVRLVRASGAQPILQTYPLHRRDGVERSADRTIRRVAAQDGVLLADVAEELRYRTKTIALDAFYAEPGELVDDNHLNRKGNEVMARQLLRVLEASPGWNFPGKAEP